jgi:hypothetical protein
VPANQILELLLPFGAVEVDVASWVVPAMGAVDAVDAAVGGEGAHQQIVRRRPMMHRRQQQRPAR